MRIDSKNAMRHVFGDEAVLDDEARYLLPAISLSKYLVQKLNQLGIRVSQKYVPSKENQAHCITKKEQTRRRRIDHWCPVDDVWPEYMPAVWRNVFDAVSANQVGKRCIHNEIDVDVFATL